PPAYTLSLHDALPICVLELADDALRSELHRSPERFVAPVRAVPVHRIGTDLVNAAQESQFRAAPVAISSGLRRVGLDRGERVTRSEEHTSELQSLAYS